MNRDHETPEEKRERLSQKEVKHPASGIYGIKLSDAVGGLSWEHTGLVILVLILAFILYSVFFG